MKTENITVPHGGMYLAPGERKRLIQEQKRWHRHRLNRKIMTLTALILADGLLIYMMAALLIHEVFGLVFVTVISVCIGYQLKGE